MKTTVITMKAMDYGVGPFDRVAFVDCKYTIDTEGNLHIYRGGDDGNVGSFPRGEWRAVVRGDHCRRRRGERDGGRQVTAGADVTRAAQSGADILARIKPTLRVVRTEICLRPDLIADLEAADAELREHIEAEALQSPAAGWQVVGRVEGGARPRPVPSRSSRTRSSSRRSCSTSVRSRRTSGSALALKHPPRPDDQFDQYAGYNRDATVDAAIRECLVDPVFDDESWEALVAVCNVSEWSEMRRATNEANGGGRRPQNRRWRRGFFPSAPPAQSRPRVGCKPPPVRWLGAAGAPRALRRGRRPVSGC